MAIIATFISTSSFSVVGDLTSDFDAGRKVKANCGVDGIKILTVQSSAFTTVTTVTTVETTLTSNLVTVLYGVTGATALPSHTHTDVIATYWKGAGTGKANLIGPGTGETRAKTVRDANDTILELGGAYTPTGAWTYTGATVLGDVTTNSLQKMILQNPTSMADHAWQGMAVLGTAGEAIAQGDILYKKYLTSGTTWRWYKYDCNGTDKLILPSGIATAAINSTEDGVILINGIMRDDTWNITSPNAASLLLWASGTAGGVTLTQPSTAGDEIVVVGFLAGPNTIQTAFGYAWVEK